ncbi:MAG: caspase family protein [Candidatus Cloacimonetes bacterium]|nr:caspase family protein [Candidatus Cloacimonadota bacterium]
MRLLLVIPIVGLILSACVGISEAHNSQAKQHLEPTTQAPGPAKNEMTETWHEAAALKSWFDVRFSSFPLEAERDAKIAEIKSPIKDEFETTAQFEQRKKDASVRIKAIQDEYSRKIADAKAAHESQIAKLRNKLQQLLASSREDVELPYSLGSYDADKQSYRVSTTGRNFEVVVPLASAKQVREQSSSYKLLVTRQLNEQLEWDYLEAKLIGSAGSFASTDKAPALSGGVASTSQSIIPPALTASYAFLEPSGNKILDAEETGEVEIKITNGGKGSAYMVEALLNAGTATGLSIPASLYFGEIKAGEVLSKKVTLTASENIKDQAIDLKISFKEQNGFPPDDKIITFSSQALTPPELIIADIGVSDQNRNGKIEPGEQAEIRVRIQNSGFGTAKSVVAKVILGGEVFFVGENQGSSSLGEMKSGEFKDIVFDIVSRKDAKALDIKLDLQEQRPRFSRNSQPLNLAFNRVERTAEQMIITGVQQSGSISAAPSLSIDIRQQIPQRAKAGKNRWGVVIGIENYRNVSPVRFASQDAEFMKEYFLKVLGIPAENLFFRSGEDASLVTFKTLFDAGGWLEKNAKNKNSEIFIYYAGHGAPDPATNKAYLLPYDGNPNYLNNSGYELSLLYSNLQKLGAKQVTIFLDSCFSGANREREIILADARPVFISSPLPQVAANFAVFSASEGAEFSSSYPEKQHGLFSYYLMKGLRGDADANGDKRITLEELQNYLKGEVRSMAARLGREQNPQLQTGDKNRVLISW